MNEEAWNIGQPYKKLEQHGDGLAQVSSAQLCLWMGH